MLGFLKEVEKAFETCTLSNLFIFLMIGRTYSYVMYSLYGIHIITKILVK